MTHDSLHVFDVPFAVFGAPQDYRTGFLIFSWVFPSKSTYLIDLLCGAPSCRLPTYNARPGLGTFPESIIANADNSADPGSVDHLGNRVAEFHCGVYIVRGKNYLQLVYPSVENSHCSAAATLVPMDFRQLAAERLLLWARVCDARHWRVSWCA